MKLITKAIAKKLPALRANEHKTRAEVQIPLKIFNPTGAGTWYITEMDPMTGLAFGYITGLGGNELGYIDMNELASIKGRFGLGMERDLHWDGNTTLEQVMNGERQ